VADGDLSDAQTPQRAAWADAAELVGRIQRGDREAEADFVRRYQRGVAVIVARACRDRRPVEDLCQEVLSTALEKIRAGAVRGPERLSGFVAGLARMIVLDHFRKEGTRSALEARMPPPPQAAPALALEQLLREEKALLVRAVLNELESDRDREILFRFYIAEEEKDRICRDLALTPLHFNRVLFRARERYRTLYRQWTAGRADGKPR
jgi:RNA polymerase sigma-70 factor (ECF subfamily)